MHGKYIFVVVAIARARPLLSRRLGPDLHVDFCWVINETWMMIIYYRFNPFERIYGSERKHPVFDEGLPLEPLSLYSVIVNSGVPCWQTFLSRTLPFQNKAVNFFFINFQLCFHFFFFLLLFLFCLCCFQTTELQLTSLRDHDLHHCFLIYTPVHWSISRCSYLPIISCYASCHCTYRYRVVMKLVIQNKAVGTLVFVFWE